MYRRWAIGVAVLTAVALLAVVAQKASAGEYHQGTRIKCNECHTMHYSESHNYTGDANSGTPDSTLKQGTLGSAGPYEYLLRNDPNDLCKSCHDGQTTIPDVVGDHANGYVREAGALPTGVAPYENWKGHELGSLAIAPGNDGTKGAYNVAQGGNMDGGPDGLECVSCHMQHGGGNYRNLRSLVNESQGASTSAKVTYEIGAATNTKDVVLGSWTLGDIATNHAVSNVNFEEPDSTKSAMGLWCSSCHNDFHGAPGSTNTGGLTVAGQNGWESHRHPTAGVDVGQQNGHGHTYNSGGRGWNTAGRTNFVKVLSNGGWTNSTASDITPTCITCHKAHGNQNPFGLVFMAGTGTVTEQGDDGTTVRELCRQCHAQGTPPP